MTRTIPPDVVQSAAGRPPRRTGAKPRTSGSALGRSDALAGARSGLSPARLAAAVAAPMTCRQMDGVIRTLRRAAPRLRPTAVAEVAAGRPDPFRVLTACLLSLRTQDGTTREASARLFRIADTPAAILATRASRLARLIFPVGFYRSKARTLRAVSRVILDRFGGRVPDDVDVLTTLPGVGRKTANLVVTIGFGKPGICVDTHVHRISNRLGFVRTRTPEETEWALRAKLARRHWIDYNDLLVAFGQNVCRPLSPHCSVCPVSGPCHRVGVTRAR